MCFITAWRPLYDLQSIAGTAFAGSCKMSQAVRPANAWH